MPFADTGGGVTRAFEILGQRRFFEWQLLPDDGMEKLLRWSIRPTGKIGGDVEAGRSLAGQDRCPGRRANRTGCICIRESRAGSGQSVEMGRMVFLAAITAQVVDAQIIRQDKNDIGFAGLSGTGG